MACLFGLMDQTVRAFSSDWRLFIVSGLLVAGLVVPAAGYILFLLALAYPLYSISIYVAALALSVLIFLAFPLFSSPRRGGASALALTLAMPLLATYRVAPAALFLAGLLWAEWGGVVVGLGGGLWLKLFAGMCGSRLDLTRLSAQPWNVDQLIARFQGANSLQTLLWMAEPWLGRPRDSQILLFNIVEVLGWGLAGYGVGLMRQRIDGASRPTLSLFASISAGLLGVCLGSLVGPVALGLRQASFSSIFHYCDFLIEYLWGGLIAIGMYGIYRYLTRPLVRQAPSRIEPYRGAPPQPSPERENEREDQPKLSPHTWEGPEPRDDKQTDIIMIDLD